MRDILQAAADREDDVVVLGDIDIEARGGLEKIKAIKTIRATGKIKGFGGRVLSMGEENARPDLVRVTTLVPCSMP